MEFGEKLKRLLLLHDESQSTIAKLCEIKPSTVSTWINQKEPGFYPKVEYLIKIADHFNLTMDELIKGDIEIQYVSEVGKLSRLKEMEAKKCDE